MCLRSLMLSQQEKFSTLTSAASSSPSWTSWFPFWPSVVSISSLPSSAPRVKDSASGSSACSQSTRKSWQILTTPINRNRYHCFLLVSNNRIGGSKGALETRPPSLCPFLFIFMQFSGRTWRNIQVKKRSSAEREYADLYSIRSRSFVCKCTCMSSHNGEGHSTRCNNCLSPRPPDRLANPGSTTELFYIDHTCWAVIHGDHFITGIFQGLW